MILHSLPIHPSLLRTFGFSAISTYKSYLPSIFGRKTTFKMFGMAVFEAIEVKRQSMLNFVSVTSKFCNHFWKFGCQRLPYFFWGWQPNFQKFEVTASKFNIACPLTSMASKTATPNIFKIVSNQCISSKVIWMDGRYAWSIG